MQYITCFSLILQDTSSSSLQRVTTKFNMKTTEDRLDFFVILKYQHHNYNLCSFMRLDFHLSHAILADVRRTVGKFQ